MPLDAVGVITTLAAVVLAAWFSARTVARACMHREHRTIKKQVETLERGAAVNVRHERDVNREIQRRLERLEKQFNRHQRG